MGFHTKEECTRGAACDIPSHRPDPTTEAMRERNDELERIKSELTLLREAWFPTSTRTKWPLLQNGENWRDCAMRIGSELDKIAFLVGQREGDTTIQAAEHLVTARNRTIADLMGERDNARAELDIARRKLEECKRASAAVPTIGAEHKQAKEELERLRSQLAEMTKQRGLIADDWWAERERSREVVDVLADYAIERIKLKREIELKEQQHEAQWESDKERLRAQEAKIRDLERTAMQIADYNELVRLQGEVKRLQGCEAMLRGQLDAAHAPGKALIDAMALSEIRDTAVQPVLDALASWSAPFAASMAHGVTEGEAANLAHLTLALHKAYKSFAEWMEEQERAIDDIPF